MLDERGTDLSYNQGAIVDWIVHLSRMVWTCSGAVPKTGFLLWTSPHSAYPYAREEQIEKPYGPKILGWLMNECRQHMDKHDSKVEEE